MEPLRRATCVRSLTIERRSAPADMRVARPPFCIADQVDDREWLPAAPLPWRSLTKCRRGIDLIFRLGRIDAEIVCIETH
jgi:hypothetical protein